MAIRKTAAFLAGIAAASRFATKAYEPSLMPRSAIDQGLITGGAIACGFVAGATASVALDFVPRSLSKPLLKTAGVVVTGSRTAEMLGRSVENSGVMTAQRAAWFDIGIELLTAEAYARFVTSKGSPFAKISATTALGGAVISDTHRAIGFRTDSPDVKYLATSAGVGIGAATALGAIVGAVRLSGGVTKHLGSSVAARTAFGLAGSAATAAAMAFGIKTVGTKFIAKIAAGNRATEIAYAKAPEAGLVTGGSGSSIPFATLGLQGRRLVSSTTTPETIERVMGESAYAEPIRVYVGIESADEEDELVELAVAELNRCGAFDRPRIIAASPAGTGYVNYIATEAAEYMSRGDCATVAIQYGSLPSMLSLGKVAKAARIYGALLRRIREEIDTRGVDCELLAYGESLGATAGQAGVLEASNGDDLIVDRALWVGTPVGSELFRRLVAAGVPVFDSPVDLAEYRAANPVPDYVFLSHHNDPVTKFAVTDAYEIPEWLTHEDRGRGTNPHQRWLPGVAFFQGLIDTKNAATVVPGQFNSSGHDYRADLASFIKAAYNFTDVSDAQLARIEGELRASEISRAEAIGLGKIHSA
jgi:uncharacterized membrane protein